MPGILTSHLMLLGLLAAGTLLVRLLLLKPSRPAASAGAVVMAAGIYTLGALQHDPEQMAIPASLFTLELLILWVYIAAGFVRAYLQGAFATYAKDPVGCFAIGTWVAGTAVLGKLVYATTPEWPYLAFALAGIMLAVWLGYMWRIAGAYRKIIIGPANLNVTGGILLSTVSTQSVVVLSEGLFPGQVPAWLAVGMIGLGFLFYALGMALIVQRYVKQRGWRLADDWDNTNCILHGAMSITGLASVLSGAVPGPLIIAIWLWAACMLVCVEGFEVARLRARVAAYGWRRGVLTYDVTQWARNFTFGMFYIFTLSIYSRADLLAGEANLPWLAALQGWIVAWGQYVVLFFLVVGVALFMAQNIQAKMLAREPLALHAAAGGEQNRQSNYN